MKLHRVRRLLALVVAGAAAAACGSGGGNGGTASAVAIEVLSDAPRSEPDPGVDPRIAGDATLAFGTDLFRAIAAATPGENVVVSPTSVAIALAMLEPGTTGDAQAQLRDLLRIDDPDAFHAAMNALEQSLEARVVESFSEDGDPGEVIVRVANAAYLQEGYPFEADYLDTVGEHYGPVVNSVDFEPDPDAVAHEINAFVAEATRDRITDLIADGELSPDTVFALVNALYLKASWLDYFNEADTADRPFTRLDGTEITVPLMDGFSDSSARGDGWVAATKPYVGDLAAQFILPDEGRFDEVAANLAAVIEEFDQRRGPAGGDLVVPRFETRFEAELAEVLKALGLTAPFEEGNLLGIAEDPRLVVDKAIHQTFVAMNEKGTEAAAATAITGVGTGIPAVAPVDVILDRPFRFRIYDQETGATLFLGQILDPTA
jgi:serpin B